MCQQLDVRYALLACRDATNQARKIRGSVDNLGLGWWRHDKLKHIGHKRPNNLLQRDWLERS